MSDTPDSKSPYTWPGPLGLNDSDLLFGRERESRLAAASATTKPLTVIYGGSGTGKTSLLHAGVAAQLNARRDSLAVVFDRWAGGDPSRALKDAVAEAALALPADETTPAVLAWRERLRDDTALDRLLGELAGASRRSVVLVLDHFEQYLRLYPEGDDSHANYRPPSDGLKSRPSSPSPSTPSPCSTGSRATCPASTTTSAG